MPDVEFPVEDYAVIIQRLYTPTYFQKLAQDWNIVPATDADRAQLLELSGLLRGARAEEVEKTAGANSFLQEAADGLKGALGQTGYETAAPTTDEKFAKEAAFQAIQDPETMKAVLGFGDYLGAVERAAAVQTSEGGQ